LPEALIATAIAAMVLTASAAAIGSVVALSRASGDRARALDDAKLIATRLRAGMGDADVLEGIIGWRLERAPFEHVTTSATDAPFEVVTARYGVREDIVLEFLVPLSTRPDR
jgi:hypothetical protein